MLMIDVKKKLGDFQLDVNVEIPTNGVTAIFGVSGSGKTSLINIIAGLSKPDEGSIVFNGETLLNAHPSSFVPAEKRRFGTIFQDFRLFPHYSVKGNLEYAMSNKSEEELKKIAHLLGLEKLLERSPKTLSGGEKQRVAIARCLLSKPRLLLMDEALASLDLKRRQELLGYFQELFSQLSLPILYVSHRLDEILKLAQGIIILEEGRVLDFGELKTVLKRQSLEHD